MEGNQMKMREVIKALLDAMYAMGIDEETVAIASESKNCHMNSSELLETIRNAKSALAEPPRNCDVGTAEEQERRFRQYCMTEECNRYRCGHGSKSVCIDRCVVVWAQMPYEAQEGDAK